MADEKDVIWENLKGNENLKANFKRKFWMPTGKKNLVNYSMKKKLQKVHK